MNSIFAMYKERLLRVANTWFALLRPEVEEDARLVQRGLLLYRQRQVYQLKLEGDYLLGTVQDVTPVKVKIDLSFLDISQCSCPADSYCRHQFAVFLAAYNEVASVEELIDKWRAPLKLKKVAEQFGLKKARDLMKTTKLSEPNYDDWIASFSESFDTIVADKKGKNSFVVNQLFKAYMLRVKACAPTMHEWKQLYLLVAAVFSFKKLLEFSVTYGFSEQIIQRHYLSSFQELVELTKSVVQKLTVHSLPFSFDDFIKKLRKDSNALLTIGVGRDEALLSHERITMYFILWDELFKKASWRTEELARLKQLVDETEPGEQQFIFFVSYLQLLYANGNDDVVLTHLKDAPQTVIPYTFHWLEQMHEQKQWQRSKPYLSTILTKCPDYLVELNLTEAREQFVYLFVRKVHTYCTAVNRFDFYEKVIIQLLPYSFRMCDDYFFNKGDYEKWTELIMYRGLHIGDLNALQLETIEKVQPELLLPIYHQSIQHHINMKNRDNYRTAVKQLKRLRALYRKLNEKTTWETYFHLLLENTKRLRAFQEECQLGKLLVVK